MLVIIQALIKICQLYPINIEWTCLHHFFINIQTSEATSTLIHTETFQGGIYISPNFHRSEKKNKTTTLEIRKNMIAFCPGLHLLYNQHNLQTAKKKKKRVSEPTHPHCCQRTTLISDPAEPRGTKYRTRLGPMLQVSITSKVTTLIFCCHSARRMPLKTAAGWASTHRKNQVLLPALIIYMG